MPRRKQDPRKVDQSSKKLKEDNSDFEKGDAQTDDVTVDNRQPKENENKIVSFLFYFYVI